MIVTLRADGGEYDDAAADTVYAEVKAFSRHGTWWSRLGGSKLSKMGQC
jgi:uncharacterized protein (UPF0548 family)